MKLDQEKSDFLDDVLQQWEEQKLLSAEEVKKLQATYETKAFDWRRLAQYSFWIAMACGVISLGALLVDKDMLTYLQKLYDTPDILISLFSAALATLLYYKGFQRIKTHSRQVFSNDALLFSAVMFTANAIAYFGKSIGHQDAHFSLLILCSVLVYGILAFVFKSKLIWAFVIISLGVWFGTETGYLSRWNWYFLGLNYPLRFVFFGLALTVIAWLLRNKPHFDLFYGITYMGGMTYLFISLWLISVFGNYGTLEDWYNVSQLSLFYWAIISAAACIVSIVIGLKYRDDVAREFGITFLFLNLYTRYFEYFWDSWHKAIFFCVLAASFWMIGKRAEKIWNLEFLKK